MKKILFIALFPVQLCFAQEATVSLDSCISWTKKNYPLLKQNQLIANSSKENISGINENWYPKLSFLAKATYQTEVVKLSLPGNNISLPHDSYLANVTLDQTIFDGGQTTQQKRIEKLNAEMEIQKNEVELYKLIDRVSQLYGNILLVKENLAVLNIYKNDLENKKENLASSIKNGLALESSMDELEAEVLKTEQSIIEAEENLKAGYASLSMYIGKSINDGTQFSLKPVGGISQGEDIVRPELKMFDIQNELLDSKFKLTNRLSLPKLSVGLGGNYGRPGPNFLNQELRFFGEGSVSLKWNISSLYGLNREKSKSAINQQMIDVQREVFLFNIKTALTSQAAQINAMQDAIKKDVLIIEKRKNVSKTAASQLENGKITVTDYLTQLNAEMQATLNQKIHEVKLMNAMTTYNTTKGINNF